MKLNRSHISVAIVLVAVAAVYFLFIHYVPYCYDDWNFREMYMRVSGGDFRFSWDRFMDYVSLVRLENDGRLSDISIILFEFMPRWVYDVFFAMCCVAWIALSAAMCTRRRRVDATGLVVFWTLAVLLLPWRDWVMGCVVFSLNYVVASTVAAVFAWVWLSRPSRVWTVGCVLLGLCAGCWHEGFGVPLACGAVLMALARKRMPDIVHWALFAGLIGGIAIAMTAPGLLARVGRDDGGQLIVIGLKYAVRDLPAAVALVFVAAAMICRPRWRGRLKECWDTTALPFFIGAFAAAMAIVLKQGLTPRVAWAAEYFAIMSLMIIFRDALKSKAVTAITPVPFVAILFFYGGVIEWQKKTDRQLEEILSLYAQSEDGTVYYDFDVETPVWTLHHPSRSQVVDSVGGEFLRGCDPQGRPLRVKSL